ncbi:MAG: delta-60 repeat domain-containing protein, partial [Chitinophagaceae bacterium]|nr:delta-60 repeat domain-containing protein [Chitinophagaceae bacterium]
MTRINVDGTNDAAFNTGGAGFNLPILSVLTRASDNRIWAGGQFTTYNGATVPAGIILLNSDGSRNTTIFTPSTGTNLQVNSIGAVPSSSDIIIAGNFTSYNGTSSIGRIARISEAGVLNTTFNTNIGTGANGSILRILVTSAGNIFLVGNFTQFNGTTVNGIAKLDINGNLDAAFAAQTGSAAGGTPTVRAIVEQSGGSLIVGGDFTNWNGTAGVNRLVRLNADGSRNGAFTAATNAPVVSLRLVPGSDAFIAGGTFTSAGTTVALLVTRQSIAAFSANGVLDANFLPNNGFTPSSFVNQLAFQSDGKLVVGGSFTAYNGITRNRIARLCGDLSVAATAQTATITSVSA